MEGFIKNLKDKLAVENVVGFMKSENVNVEEQIKEEEVRKTLQKIDPNNIIDTEEIASKLNEISEQSQAAMQDVKNQAGKLVESTKSNFGVLQKSSHSGKTVEEDNPYTKNDNILAFFD